MTKVVPAIIPNNFIELSEEIKKVKDFCNLVQIDICDGEFAENKTWPYKGDNGEFLKLSNQEMSLPFWQDIDFEVHLMVNNPEYIIDKWISFGVKSVIFQIESTSHPDDIISLLKQNEVLVGISIKPKTENEKILPILDKVDFLQIMGSNKLGVHNEHLDESAISKIKYFREKFPNLDIAIDIGVNRDTAENLVQSGANKLVSGSSIFEGNIKENFSFFEGL